MTAQEIVATVAVVLMAVGGSAWLAARILLWRRR